jgi:hypothetical protein
MKSKKRPLRSKSPRTGSSADRETTLRFYLPKDLAVKAWNMAATEGLSFNAYCIKLLVKADARLREEKAKILTFPKQRRRRP